jgi:hypothetical protein
MICGYGWLSDALLCGLRQNMDIGQEYIKVG